MIRGEAKTAHENITKDLVEKFDSFPLHERIPPHLTLKRWFEFDQKGMDDLYKCIDWFTNSHKQSDYTLTGFGHFGTDVIYADVLASAEMKGDVLEFIGALHGVDGMTWDEFDNGGNFHATVAMGALKPFDYDQIWNYLQAGTQPNFKMKFDNIAVLKRENERWVVERVFEIEAQ